MAVPEQPPGPGADGPVDDAFADEGERSAAALDADEAAASGAAAEPGGTSGPPGPPPAPSQGGEGWYDEAAGPVVRPYALTGGRTQYDGHDLDMVALIETADEPEDPGHVHGLHRGGREAALDPEHEMILSLCRTPLSVVEIASDLELPLGVVRVLLGDLLDRSLVRVRRPAPVAQFPGERVLKEVIDGIRAL
ncbi:DUF742 domain-containing protein [Spirillospora sp. NPDC052269]